MWFIAGTFTFVFNAKKKVPTIFEGNSALYCKYAWTTIIKKHILTPIIVLGSGKREKVPYLFVHGMDCVLSVTYPYFNDTDNQRNNDAS